MRFAVVGDPIAHSRSPAIHTAGFRNLGIDATYEHWQVAVDEFDLVVDALREGSLDGVNVTMPHKGNAWAAVDERSSDAERTGAVNTIVVRSDRLVGHNTDVAGVRHALGRIGADDTAEILLLGAGGAAAAALMAVEMHPVVVSARTSDAAQAVLRDTGVEGRVASWGTMLQGAIVINATPLGMHGENLPDGVVERAGSLIDMAYGANQTPAVWNAVNIGLPYADGIDMLVGQAVEAFELFTGRTISPFVLDMAART